MEHPFLIIWSPTLVPGSESVYTEAGGLPNPSSEGELPTADLVSLQDTCLKPSQTHCHEKP